MWHPAHTLRCFKIGSGFMEMNAHSVTVEEQPISPRALRDVLGQFATGVTVISTLGDNDAPVGLTANSFASVSLDPPLVAWSLSRQAPSYSAFQNHKAFAINILCDQSMDLALKFARPAPDKFADVDWFGGVDGVPLLRVAATTIECQTESRIPAGDHEIYVGRVINFHQTDKPPLVFYKGKFTSLGDLT